MRGKRIGERLEIPSGKSKWQSVLGFMWQGCQKFSSFVFEGSITSEIVIECINKIARKLNKPTVLVIDNAPIHRSEEFAEKIEGWEQKGLDIYYLPTYSSELNKQTSKCCGRKSNTNGCRWKPINRIKN